MGAEYTLADHFFMGAFGGSYLNHQWLVCACTPRDDTRRRICAPARRRAAGSSGGRRRRRRRCDGAAAFDGEVTPDGYSRQHRRSRRTSRAASRRRPAAIRASRTRAELHAAAADAEDDRRHAVGEGHLLGVVRRRRGTPALHDGMQPPGRQAQGDLQRATAGADLPAAPPAVQLFRALRTRHRRPRART